MKYIYSKILYPPSNKYVTFFGIVSTLQQLIFWKYIFKSILLTNLSKKTKKNQDVS